MEDLAQKEKLSKLAILDTLLVKKEPLSESEEVVMGLDYSYTQPSDSEDYGLWNSADSGNSSTEMNIMLDQAEIEAAQNQYPLQPEVEFGFPKECYCGREPLLATSYTRNDPGRRFYTCDNIDDGDCHVYKWWDVAVTEEIKALGTQYAQLSDKVDYLSFLSDDDTHMREFKDLQFDLEQKLLRAERIGCDLARNTSRLFRIACVMVVVLVLIGIGLAARIGQNENDVLKSAHQSFHSDHNTKFTLEHAWCILRHEQKWLSLNTAAQKRKATESFSQATDNNVGDQEMRPEGIKAAKASRNSGKGKAYGDYKSMWDLKMEDLAQKEKLSKLAILDTLLAKKEPLSESEEVVMGLDYSYTQPSDSEDYGLRNSTDSGNSSTEMNIMLDQAEIKAVQNQYPLQPEVEFGFPKECYCGREPLLATSYTRNDPGRRFYSCDNIDDGDCHVYKWWDVVVTEEIKALGTQYAQLSDKVDYLSFLSDDDTHMREFKDRKFDLEQKLLRVERIGCDLARNTSRLFRIACVMVVVLVLIGIGLAARM
ncbi:hypothetical protein DY000_02045971 [Brassica cretica]|uniref:GRF-type domain-containing protein n=2 Tax=Brassica cretica TaxID=69181 RepID=A0ABQ7ERC0_BRACR|nr:hypothetical protein DY000_02045971 [Brassica cretica]